VPRIEDLKEAHYFDEEFTKEKAAVSLEDPSLIDDATQKAFEGFTCGGDSVLDKL
jgi:hypothetical protein